MKPYQSVKYWAKNLLTRHLLHTILVSDVIYTDKGKIFLQGKEITHNELAQLQAEVKALEGFRIWSIMTNSVRHIAHDKIFNKSLSFEDVMAGKLMLLNLDTIESIAKVIKNKV